MIREQNFDYLFKVVIVGDSGVGKTNLLSQFVDGTFTIDTRPTIGVEFATKTITTLDNKLAKNQIWDTAGQQRFRALTNAYYRGAQGAIIVFDLTKNRTFENLDKWLTQLREHSEEDISILLLGNKCDLEERDVSSEAIQNYTSSNKLIYMETSALSGYNVDEAFADLTEQMYLKSKKQYEDVIPMISTPHFQTPQQPLPKQIKPIAPKKIPTTVVLEVEPQKPLKSGKKPKKNCC